MNLLLLHLHQEKAKKSKDDDKKGWDEEETSELISFFEENPCLWDVHHDTYSNRDMKSLAWQKIADNFHTNVDCIKIKINVLRTQLGREVNLESSSGPKIEDL